MVWNFPHVLTAAVYIIWRASKVWMEKSAKWWRHTLELYDIIKVTDAKYRNVCKLQYIKIHNTWPNSLDLKRVLSIILMSLLRYSSL